MPDRLQEIRARLDAATPGEWPVGTLVPYLLPSDADFIAHAPDDIAWLLDQLTIQQADNKADVEEIYALRDEVNALWDVVCDLVGNNGDDIDDVSKYFLKRLAIQKEMRTGNLDIKYLGNKIAKDRRAALEELAQMSEELPGGYLGDTE